MKYIIILERNILEISIFIPSRNSSGSILTKSLYCSVILYVNNLLFISVAIMYVYKYPLLYITTCFGLSDVNICQCRENIRGRQ
jgi:hypothetical protein